LGSSGGVNPADPFLVCHDELPELTSDQCTALAEIAKTGGRLTDGALSRETLEDLLRLRAVMPAGPGRVAITSTGLRLLAKAVQRSRP
jgi:hypothetical protein